ncbi:unnamed protein product [Arctia plantaginis]|uniref:RRM domain-containing protein n=1 Tax=Arctia plantaginis TaxID=874455 RepID=A0A8S1B3X1_ARCPL|nr:unnamed protein product [Arctia plantaginis]
MNSWGNEHFSMPNIIAMTGVMPNLVPSMTPSLVQPYNVIGDMNQIGQHMNQIGPPVVNQVGPMNQIAPSMNQIAVSMTQVDGPVNHLPPGPLIGPVQSDPQGNIVAVVEEQTNDGSEKQVMNVEAPEKASHSSRERSDRRDRDRVDRDRDRSRRRSRSRNRDRDYNKDRKRNNRRERSRNDHRERHSKWDDDKYNQQLNLSAVMMQAHQPSMMQYGNIMPGSMMQHQIEMTNMQQMMQIPGMNMAPNMMMMNTQMQTLSLPMYFSTGVILPPLPGTSVPPRRERPSGCRTILVGGVPQAITEDVVTEIFQRFGDIEEVKLHKGVCHVRFIKQDSVEQSFSVTGCRLKAHDQNENEATTLYIDFALNREDQNEYEKNKRRRESTPQRVEPYTPATFSTISDKIKSDSDFADAASDSLLRLGKVKPFDVDIGSPTRFPGFNVAM